MKRIAFALCATIVFLSTMAQGNIEKRLPGNPKIDSLVLEVYQLGNYIDVSYSFDGKLHKAVKIFCSLMNDFVPTASTGNAKLDTRNRLTDSVRQLQVEQKKRMYEAIRNTCKSLIDDAKESYVWEYHRGGVDSVRYAIAIGEYQNGDTLTTYRHERGVHYSRAPELVSFEYNSYPNNERFQGSGKGYGHFWYEYTPDSVYKKKEDIVPLDKDAYMKLILPILKQEGITSRQFYVYHDSTYTIVRKDRNEDDFVMREQTAEPKQTKSETKGTVYTLHSKTQADSVLSQIRTATLSFLSDNPNVLFDFHPYINYGNRQWSNLFDSEYLSRVPDFYRIYLHNVGEEYNIMIVEGKGDMMIPAEWSVVKSWRNGKVTYDKRAMKKLTPKQAREKTRGISSFITSRFEPFE